MMVASHCPICNSTIIAVSDTLWQMMHEMHMKRHVLEAANRLLKVGP